jgi:pyruvate formate-lyase/glycerol dehydratase family glycyl radical enzyme
MAEVQNLNAQEMRKLNVLTDRVQKRRQEWEQGTAIVCPESSLSFTKSWKETDGQPLDLRWAYAFQKRLEEAPLKIWDGELIVGSLTKDIKGIELIAALKPMQVLDMLRDGRFARVLSDTAAATIDPGDAKLLNDDVQYWVDHLPPDYINERIYEALGEDHKELFIDRGGVYEGPFLKAAQERGLFQDTGSWGGIVCLHAPVIDNGLSEVIARAEREIEKISEGDTDIASEPSPLHKKYILLKAIIISCKAVIAWAGRYGELAQEMAMTTEDPARRDELQAIAGICRWVPANRPRSFWEAVQSARFLHLAVRKEQPHRPENSVGRLDQILYPYYREDVENGRITRQDAAELLGCFWLKTREGEILQTQPPKARIAPGSNLPQVTIGGRDENGNDVTNEVSWLILEVMRQIRLSEPAVYVRYHTGLSDEFLLYALECNRDMEGGIPAFLNDELGTARHLARGIEPKDAVDWAASGCLGYHLECTEHGGGQMHLNQAKILELTLHNGFDPRTGKQLGPKTGDVTTFASIDQFYDAFLRQEDYFAEEWLKDYFVRWSTDQEIGFNSGLSSAMLFEESIPKGLAPSKGGTKYPAECTGWVGDRGITDVADSLTAIKYLVFDKKEVTMAQLLEAMKNDWENNEDLRQRCLRAPKYGNDDDYADEVFQHVTLKTQEILLSRPDPFTGAKPFLYKGAAAGHVIHGLFVGALPNGRHAGTPVNDAGTSAMPGVDTAGPTALVNSATKLPNMIEYKGVVHNMKFSKALFGSPAKLRKLLMLLRTFFARGGWHIQFNISSPEELLDAKEHPENWRNLMVRVGGYSAYFVDLPGSLQDEIITRTLHE